MSLNPNLQIEPPQFTECLPEDTEVRQSSTDSRRMAARLQELVDRVQAQPNPAARALLQECLQTLLGFYGEGLARMLAHLQASGPDGERILQRLLQDHVVSGLLLIHGLHPVALETRLHAALSKVRPYMQSHGGNIELLGLENDVARVRLQGTCQSCPSSNITLELAVRRAIEEACPDLLGFEVENGTPAPTSS
jgi:Fe-S cluster biogenesis protein NfuA